jgi:nitrogen fixation NifU-like protein
MVSPSEDSIRDEAGEVFSQAVIDRALRPRNMGEMENADGFGQVTGPCGDTMMIWLRVKGDLVLAASFATDGCGPTVACGSRLTELVRGKTVSQALSISQQDVLDALDGLPESHEHCALLAVNTLKGAVRDYLAFKREPWKRAYRTSGRRS